MAHPAGGQGNNFQTVLTFQQAYNHVLANQPYRFPSTTEETITATTSNARIGVPTIVFIGEHVRHGSVCRSCWGYRKSCNGRGGERIGHCSEGLDQYIPNPSLP